MKTDSLDGVTSKTPNLLG